MSENKLGTKVNKSNESKSKMAKKKNMIPSLLTKEQMQSWLSHRENVINAPPRVDVKAPKLIPELYMQSRILEKRAQVSRKKLIDNLDLLCKINRINRLGGKTDCWLCPKNNFTKEKLRKKRMLEADKVGKENKELYHKLNKTEAVACKAQDLRVEWKHTLEKIKLMGRFPFCLEGVKPIHQGMSDPDFVDISGRRKYWFEFNADGGIYLGNIIVELFEKVCPLTCQVFKNLVKGHVQGDAYSGTSLFMIVPNMFCSMGDTTRNNGFGGISLDDQQTIPENFFLKHSIPGVLSMHITDGQINGIFNISFKPMPLLNGKAVVFGRIVSGNSSILECISEMGTPLGMPRGNPIISRCGWINKRNKKCKGPLNSIFTI